MSAGAHAPTPSEYIVHHLGHFSTKPQGSIVDFGTFNIDTFVMSVSMGVLGCLIMWLAARKVTAGVPGRFQAFVEMMVEMVEEQSKSIVHGNRQFIAPLALTIFVWVTLMNSLDFLPVDMFAAIFRLFGNDHAYFRAVPTADLNGTLGMSLGVLALSLYYGIKIKGLGGFIHELFAAPFGIAMAPFNFILQVIEYIAKTVSLAMRLFGNMFAGELLFMVIAMLGSIGETGSVGNIFGVIGHAIAGSAWAIFHILIVLLQAFIFMMLALVYIGQAHEAH